MTRYEEHISWLSDLSYTYSDDPDVQDALDEAANALAFAQALHDMFRTNGVRDLSEDPDLDKLENLIDAHLGELAAATLFLGNLDRPDPVVSLRGIADNLASEGTVPTVVTKGFSRLADRVELRKKEIQGK